MRPSLHIRGCSELLRACIFVPSPQSRRLTLQTLLGAPFTTCEVWGGSPLCATTGLPCRLAGSQAGASGRADTLLLLVLLLPETWGFSGGFSTLVEGPRGVICECLPVGGPCCVPLGSQGPGFCSFAMLHTWSEGQPSPLSPQSHPSSCWRQSGTGCSS